MFHIKIHIHVFWDRAIIQADTFKYSASFCKATFGYNENY